MIRENITAPVFKRDITEGVSSEAMFVELGNKNFIRIRGTNL